MSEYWKSTPRYWCKHCKTFVRDTKLETANHNATTKHQGNLKRFLRDLHRNNEKSEKDKDRAKSEVARLNSLISQTRSGEVKSSSVGPRNGAIPEVKATESQRKQNLLQLAEMGINIPSEVRPSMAMAGEWEVVSERIIEEDKQGNNSGSISIGVRKRNPAKGEEEEEEEEEMLETHKKRWGSTYKVPKQDDDEDLDNLLSNTNLKRKIPNIKSETMEEMSQDKKTASTLREGHTLDDLKPVSIKREPSESWDKLSEVSKSEQPDKPEIPAAIPTATFKKRKTKNIRQKN